MEFRVINLVVQLTPPQGVPDLGLFGSEGPNQCIPQKTFVKRCQTTYIETQGCKLGSVLQVELRTLTPIVNSPQFAAALQRLRTELQEALEKPEVQAALFASDQFGADDPQDTAPQSESEPLPTCD
jgi:hypothetical protein